MPAGVFGRLRGISGFAPRTSPHRCQPRFDISLKGIDRVSLCPRSRPLADDERLVVGVDTESPPGAKEKVIVQPGN
jgi:hypothetical protein